MLIRCAAAPSTAGGLLGWCEAARESRGTPSGGIHRPQLVLTKRMLGVAAWHCAQLADCPQLHSSVEEAKVSIQPAVALRPDGQPRRAMRILLVEGDTKIAHWIANALTRTGGYGY